MARVFNPMHMPVSRATSGATEGAPVLAREDGGELPAE
jgi:hypothetical protein